MKPYAELTDHGKKLRLRKVIEIGLESYDLEIVAYKFFEEATNMLYKLTAADGTHYMLKIFDDSSSVYEDNLVEAFMLDTVAERTSMDVPAIVHGRSGEPIIRVDSSLTETPRRMVIYRWMDGKIFDGAETDEGFYKIGESMAKLHQATEGISLPEGLKAKRFDKVYYFADEVPVYREKQYEQFLSPEYYEIMDRLVPLIDVKLQALFEQPGMQLIHGDMNPWNMLIDGEHFSVIDYEDTSWGYAVQDIAIALFYYKYDENFDYEKVKAQLFQGYESVRPLPEFDDRLIEFIMIARRLNFLNYILIVSDDPKEYIELNVKRVQGFMEAYDVVI